MKSSIKKHIFDTEIENNTKTATIKKCFAFGYLDGYFGVLIYEKNLSYGDFERKYYLYGNIAGEKDKELEKNTKEYQEKRKNWIISLAKYDSINGITDRAFHGNDKNLYDLYFTSENKVGGKNEKKRKRINE